VAACALPDVASSLQGQAQSGVLALKEIKELCGGKFVGYIQNHRNSKLLAMSEKKTIRIIKKGEKSRPVVKTKANTNTARETARDMVGTVTNWVNEFQQRRRAETTNALRILSKTPRGSEA